MTDNSDMKPGKGFTLVEIMVSLVVFSLIMTAMGSAFYKIYQDWVRQRDYLAGSEQVRWAMEFMSNEIREGNVTTADNRTAKFSPIVTGRGLYFEVDSAHAGGTPPRDKVFYWLGIGTADEGSLYTLYRSKVDNSRNFAYANDASLRRVITYGIVDGMNIFNISDIGTRNATVGITLTFRPRPDKPEGAGNHNHVFMTVVRPRD